MLRPLAIATTLIALAASPAALADNGKGHKGHKGHAAVQNGVWTNPAGVNHPHGMPPGQAKKIARSRGDLIVGNILPASYPGYRVLNDVGAYSVPVAPAGYEYVRVGNDVYLRQTTTGVIANVLANLIR